MAYQEFDGKLDETQQPAGFKEFTGELDAGDQGAQEPQEVVTSARAWNGAGAGRGSVNDPRRMDANGGYDKLVRANAVRAAAEKLKAINPQATEEQLTGLAESAFNPATGEVEIEKNRNQNTQDYMDGARENLLYQQGLDRIKSAANQSPISSALGSGLVSAATGIANAPQALINAPLEYIDQVGGAITGEKLSLPKVPKWGFTKEAMDVAAAASPDVANKGIGESLADGDFGTMLLSNLAQSAPSSGLSVAAMFAPPLRAALLPMMGAMSTGQSYAQGDSAIASVLKGGVEVGTEMLPLGVFDKARDFANKLPLPDRQAFVAVVARKVQQAGGEVTSTALSNFVEEAAAQFGGNLIDRAVQGKKGELSDGVLKSGVIGAASGAAMASPVVVQRAMEPGSKQDVIERELAAQLDSGRFSQSGANAEVIDTLRTEGGNLSPRATVKSFADPSGPASQAGITPIVVPIQTQTRVPDGSAGDAATGILPAGSTGAGDLAGPGVGDPGRVDGVTGGLRAAAGVPARSGPAAQSVSPAGSQPATDVDPIKRTADKDLLAQVPVEREPLTILMGTDGKGLTEGDAKLQAEMWGKRHVGASWEVEPLDNGRFRVAAYVDQGATDDTATVPNDSLVGGQREGGGGNEGQADARGIQGVENQAERAVSQNVPRVVRDTTSPGASDRAAAQPTLDALSARDPNAPKVTLGDPTPAENAAVQRIVAQTKNIFGVAAKVVAFSDPSPNSVNGLEWKKTVFINTKGLTSNATRTAWHETHHVMQALAEADTDAGLVDTPAQKYIQKVDAIFDTMSESGKRSYIEKFLYPGAFDGLTGGARETKMQELLAAPKTRKEMMADFIGNRATDVAFIKSLAKADPQGFAALAKKWLATIDSLIQQLRGNGKNTESANVDRYVADLNKSRMIFREALVQLRKDGAISNSEQDNAPAMQARQGGERDSIGVTLSAATSKIGGLKQLQDRANAGDAGAARLLNNIAFDSLTNLTSEIPSAKIERTDNAGLYFGELEPSLGLSVSFDNNDRGSVLAALAKFADNYKQHQVHVRQPTSDYAGTTYDDGSYATVVRSIQLKNPLAKEEASRIIEQSGLVGLTYNNKEFFAYYIGAPDDAAALSKFESGFDRAIAANGENGAGARREVARLWVYGDGDVNGEPVIPYSAIGGNVRTRPAQANRTANRVAEDVAGRPINPAPQVDITPAQRRTQERIRDAYEAMPLNSLDNPDVQRAYSALSTEVKRQFEALPVQIEVWKGIQGEPYKNSNAMRQDVQDNNHLFIYGTDAATFGPEGVVYENHPLLEGSGLTDIKGNPLLANDLLRAVHDYYAHTISPVQFGPKGEEAAWKNHMEMTNDPWARWALTSETRGQNSWVNFREGVDKMTMVERGFAPQKVGLLPIEFAMSGGKQDASMRRLSDDIGKTRQKGTVPDGYEKPSTTEEQKLQAAADADRPVYGNSKKGATPVTAYHFSVAPRTSLNSEYSGKGLKGAEQERLQGSENNDIRPRAYFYVDKGNGVMPEFGVGPYAHSVDLMNVYDVTKDALGIVKDNPGANNWERAVKDAGFDGYINLDPSRNQGLVALIGKHTIPVKPLGMRSNRPGSPIQFMRRQAVEDFKPSDPSEIDDLGNFNLDRANSEDYGFPEIDATKLDAPATEAQAAQRLRNEVDDAQQFRAEIARELENEGFRVVGTPKLASTTERNFAEVAPKEIKQAGLMAESAYPDLEYSQDPVDATAQRAFFVVDGKRYKAIISSGSPKVEGGAIESNVKKGSSGFAIGYEMSRLTDKGKMDWNKRYAASADLFRRGFDLYTTVPADARARVLATWKAVAENPDAFEFAKADGATGKTVREVAQAVADQMMAGGRYEITIGSPEYNRSDSDFGMLIEDTKTGTTGKADVEFSKASRTVVMHTHELDKGSGMGKPVYQIGQAFADKFKARINADGLLLGVNNYRRTEQMFSGALRSGNVDTMQPGVGQRIYGWNDRTKNQEQQDRNLVRVALASARNAMEFLPQIKEFGYDLETGRFYLRADPTNLAAEDRIKMLLGTRDVRTMSISRSTLARAAITLQAIDGDVQIPYRMNEPVLYLRKQRQFDERTDVAPMLDELRVALKTKGASQIDRLMQRFAIWRTKLASVNEREFQDELIAIGARSVKAAVDAGVSKDDRVAVPVVIGATPNVLRMLGVDMAPLRIDSRIVGKVLVDKHGKDFAGFTPEQMIRAIYQPVLITSTQAEDEYEFITSLTSPVDGFPLMFAIKRNAFFEGQRGDNGNRMKPLMTHAIKSAYEKPMFWSVQLRDAIRKGKLLYADVGQLQELESKNPALGRVMSSVGESQYPKQQTAKPVAAGTASLPPSSDGESLRNERANVSIGSAQSGLVAPSASRLTKDISKSVMAGNVKGYGDLVNFVSEKYNGDGDQMPMFSAKQPRAPGLADESWFMQQRRRFQDQFIQIRNLQDALTQRGGTVGEEQDVYGAEERMHGRTQELLTDFANNQIKPFIDKAVGLRVALDEIALYAYAMHAKERNAHISTINTKIGDAGSGMSDAEADNIIQMVQLSGDAAAFDELHQDMMGITATSRRVLLDEGLITQDEYDAWDKQYDNYVPLRGFEGVDDDGNKSSLRVGRGFSTTGKESVRALGRKSKAGQILENIIRDYERAVIRSERNQVSKTFLDLALTNPDPDLWEVQPVKMTRSMNKATGLVLMKTSRDTGEDTIAIKVGGQDVRVKIKDPLVLRAMKLAGKDETSQLERILATTLGTYTNLMRNTLTRYNPIFGAINAVRDSQMGLVSAYDELGAEGAKLYSKYLASAMAASFRQERGKADPANKVMDRWIMEMRFAGGTTGGYHLRDTSEITDTMRDMMLAAGAAPTTKMDRVRASMAYQGASKALDWLEIIGSTSEDAARAAAYRAAREMGKTPAQAASISKNLTTNFNRKGEWGGTLNQLFLFFNAGVQGSTRVLQALGNPRVQKLMAGATAAAMTLAFMNAGMGDDDDGQAYWDKIPDYEKERNLIFMLPAGVDMDGAVKVGNKGRYIKIPMAYGLNVFAVLGNQLADTVRYAKDRTRGVGPVKSGVRIASAVFGSINPFGGSVDLTDPIQAGMAVAPTAVDFGIQLAAGVNSFGRPVGPTRSPFDDSPDSENYSARQAGSASQRLAKWMNETTGGSEARSGAIDVMPGTIDNVVRNATGGLGVFLADTFINLPSKVFSPTPPTSRDIPLYRNFYGEVDGVTDLGLFYERRADVTKEAKAADAEMKLGIQVDYSEEQLAKMALAKVATTSTKLLTALKKREIEIAADENMTRGEKMIARKEIEAKRAELARGFNATYMEKQRELAGKR